jgi:tripartite-type tricarboxylate transporter receptor subunit TctC
VALNYLDRRESYCHLRQGVARIFFQSMTDLLGEQVKAMFDLPNKASPQIRNGVVNGLAIMEPERVSGLPDMPTTAELGRPTIRFANWQNRAQATRIQCSELAEVIKRAGIPLLD